MSDKLEGALESLCGLDAQALRLELANLHAVRRWAINSLHLNYEVGDRVEICTPAPAITAREDGHGWHRFVEGLVMGQSGVVRSISFNEHSNKWQVGVAMDRMWSVQHDGAGKVQRRFWYGPEAEMPEGDGWVSAEEKVKVFHFDVRWVRA